MILFIKSYFQGNLDLPRFGGGGQLVFNCFPDRSGEFVSSFILLFLDSIESEKYEIFLRKSKPNETATIIYYIWINDCDICLGIKKSESTQVLEDILENAAVQESFEKTVEQEEKDSTEIMEFHCDID